MVGPAKKGVTAVRWSLGNQAWSDS